MSMTEPVETMAEPWDDLDASPSVVRTLPARRAIVPKNSIAGRSLTAVVAIMTFLAVAHDRRRDAGGERRERLAIGCGPRGDNPGAAGARPQYRR